MDFLFFKLFFIKNPIVRAAENLHLELKDYGDIVSPAIAPGALKTKC